MNSLLQLITLSYLGEQKINGRGVQLMAGSLTGANKSLGKVGEQRGGNVERSISDNKLLLHPPNKKPWHVE